MQTRLTLTIGGASHTLADDCLRNWEDITCAYKRSDLGGVIRSFTSKFEFVGEAYDLLLAEFLANGVESSASVSVSIINDSWVYDKMFECELDFATASIADYTFSVSAIDNSLAATLKAEKGTKQELLVGTDIKRDDWFDFDRIPMRETAEFKFTQGDSDSSGALSIQVERADGSALWIGNTSKEISIGGFVEVSEDQDPSDYRPCVLRARRNLNVQVYAEVVTDATRGNSYHGNGLQVFIRHEGYTRNVKRDEYLCSLGVKTKTLLGTYSSVSDLNAAHAPHEGSPVEGETNLLAIVNGIVWYLGISYETGSAWTVWKSSGQTAESYSGMRTTGHCEPYLEMEPGDRIVVYAKWGTTDKDIITDRIISSSIRLVWKARGDAISVPAFKPNTLLNAILRKINHGTTVPIGRIRGNSRLANTRLVAAESIRGISNDTLYSSFSEFCDWIETVYGYTYYLGEPYPSALTSSTIPEAEGIISDTSDVIPYTGGDMLTGDTSNIYYNSAHNKFVLRKGGSMYEVWDGYSIYNRSMNGTFCPFTDRLYRIGGKLYFFEPEANGYATPIPIEYGGSESERLNPMQDVVFVHRSALFDANAAVKDIANAREMSCSVDKSLVYSEIEIGYSKQEYDSANGRDEWNFSQSYTTGTKNGDKKLTLTSKYRADCYGMEFAAQKRDESTTDTSSDSDVFFILCARSGDDMVPDRSAIISGALSDGVFNGLVSPMHCVAANEGYIGIQHQGLRLRYASSTGNQSISVNGVSVKTDITLGSRLIMPITAEFTTDDSSEPSSVGDLVRVTSEEITYTGYISELEIRSAREQAYKYKILVKSITA